MDRMEFYLTPLIEIDLDNMNISKIEKRIFKYCNLIESLGKDTRLMLPYDYFDSIFINCTPLGNCLYDEKINISRDMMEYLRSTLMQLGSSDEYLDNIIKIIDDYTEDKLIALVGLDKFRYIDYSDLYIDNLDKIKFAFRYYIKRSRNFEDYTELLDASFPNLTFHTRVFTTIRTLDSISEHSTEICRHLSILNDHGKELFLENKDNLMDFYRILKSKYSILGSGKGSNEELGKYLCNFKDDKGNQVTVRCNPHTKLYVAHSDYRIYFNFGRPDLYNGNILIGHIGRHWV